MCEIFHFRGIDFHFHCFLGPCIKSCLERAGRARARACAVHVRACARGRARAVRARVCPCVCVCARAHDTPACSCLHRPGRLLSEPVKSPRRHAPTRSHAHGAMRTELTVLTSPFRAFLTPPFRAAFFRRQTSAVGCRAARTRLCFVRSRTSVYLPCRIRRCRGALANFITNGLTGPSACSQASAGESKNTRKIKCARA